MVLSRRKTKHTHNYTTPTSKPTRITHTHNYTTPTSKPTRITHTHTHTHIHTNRYATEFVYKIFKTILLC